MNQHWLAPAFQKEILMHQNRLFVAFLYRCQIMRDNYPFLYQMKDTLLLICKYM